jgi:hypothetical protein
MPRFSLAAVAVALFVAGCQSSPPQGDFRPVCVPRAVDAGRCSTPTNFRLFPILIGAESWD